MQWRIFAAGSVHAVALAECCISDKNKIIGANISSAFGIRHSSLRYDALLFGESQSRVIISCSKDKVAKIEALARQNGGGVRSLGWWEAGVLKIDNLIKLQLSAMTNFWLTSITKSLSS